MIADPNEIAKILSTYKSIHTLGLSANPERVSHHVAEYMKGFDYRMIPVHPKAHSVLGEKGFASLMHANEAEPIEFVDVFLNSKRLPAMFEQFKALPELKIAWLQLGVRDAAFEEAVRGLGVTLVVDRCVKKEHERLLELGVF